MRDPATLVAFLVGVVVSGFYLRRVLAKSSKLGASGTPEPEAPGVEVLQVLRRVLALVLVLLVGMTGYLLYTANKPWVWYTDIGEEVKSDRRRWVHEIDLAWWIWAPGFCAAIFGLVPGVWNSRRNGLDSSLIDWTVAFYLLALSCTMLWFTVGRALSIT